MDDFKLGEVVPKIPTPSITITYNGFTESSKYDMYVPGVNGGYVSSILNPLTFRDGILCDKDGDPVSSDNIMMLIRGKHKIMRRAL